MSNASEIIAAIRIQIACSNINTTLLARSCGMSDVTIRNILAEKHEPGLYKVMRLLEAVGLRLEIVDANTQGVDRTPD